MADALEEQLHAKIEAGEGEQIEGHGFVPLVTLDSGARFGLAVRLREQLGPPVWARAVDEGFLIFREGTEPQFAETMEQGRAELDEQIERGAEEQGLPVDAVLLSFPTVPLVGAMLGTRSAYYCRLALMFLLPSELRELRDEIGTLAEDRAMPKYVRELAERLTVSG